MNEFRDPPQILGEAPAWTEALARLSAIARIDRPFLIIGERGTGKELAAERAHFLSPRWEGPLVKVNCAALPEELLDSELFGHEAGAFTGARARHIGRFERAHRGGLFLDEIASASARLQEKILRVVEYGTLERVGGDRTVGVDVRVIAAANVDLPALANAGKFRADLLDRLAFEVITLPPLRARMTDIPLLARHFGRRMARELDASFPDFAPETLAALCADPWPGNIRALKNAAERVIARWILAGHEGPAELGPGGLDPFQSGFRPLSAGISGGMSGGMSGTPSNEAAHFPPPVPGIREQALPADEGPHAAPTDMASPPAIGFADSVARYERKLVLEALAAHHFRQNRAATALGLSYDQFRGLLRKYAITPAALKPTKD